MISIDVMKTFQGFTAKLAGFTVKFHFKLLSSLQKDGPGDGKKKVIKIIDPKRAQV